MRPRIKRGLIASSDVSKVHKYNSMLGNNHRNNEVLFTAINNDTSIVITPKSDLERFEEGVKRAIERFKISL